MGEVTPSSAATTQEETMSAARPLLQQQGFPAGATPECAHDWRVNPVVVATTTTGDCELWTCVKCKAQTAGPRLSGVQSKHPVNPFNPETWELRGR